MTITCNQCKKFTAVAESVKCNGCSSIYHRSCVGGGAGDGWLCGACEPPPAAEPARADRAPQEAADARFPYSLAREIKLLRASVTREMGSMRLELSRLNAVVADFGKRLDGVEARLAEPERAARAGGAEDAAEIVARLRVELDEREQDGYQNDVEIAGLEERAGEDLAGAVLLVAGRLGVALEERDVVSAQRRGARRPVAGGPGGAPGPSRPRPVVVRLARRALRDALLRAARAQLGVPWAGAADGRLYVNERLTAANRQLLYRARETARRAGWRYVWSRGGRVFVRLGDRASVRRVRSPLDLLELFPEPA